MLPHFRSTTQHARNLYVRQPCRFYPRAASSAAKEQRRLKEPELQDGHASASKERQNGSNDNGRPGKSAIRLPAFALFAVGLPVGLYLSNFRQRSQISADPTQFIKYQITRREDVSSTCAIFTLRPAGTATIAAPPSAEWAITSVEFKQPQLQIARSYTCLPPHAKQGPDELRFLIRREQHGEVSSFLHRLPIGADVEIRGPRIEYAIPDDVKSAIFLSGGTGIAPAMQAADVLDGEADLHIFWSSRRREDCIGGINDTLHQPIGWNWRPWSQRTLVDGTSAVNEPSQVNKGAIVAQLEYLKASFAASPPGQPRLTIDYLVDEEKTFLDAARVKACTSMQSCNRDHERRRRNLILVSGPTGFISHWAGPKQWSNGTEVQGPLGGVLSTMNLEGWEVVKL